MVCKLYLNKALKKLNQLYASISMCIAKSCNCDTQKTTMESTLEIYRMWKELFEANLFLSCELKEGRVSGYAKEAELLQQCDFYFDSITTFSG